MCRRVVAATITHACVIRPASGIRPHGTRRPPPRFGSTAWPFQPLVAWARGLAGPNFPRVCPASDLPWSGTSRFAGTKRVSDGTRTRGRRDHNPELYQLSYAHQAGPSIAPGAVPRQGGP